ncbi:hypothetical protein BDW02DRAFT_425051 [Decorospora gaudefroyi]|uniref:Uncharacterized protein n=1 Tax=Decorospora gaudefroyi TaxID=184978 RepID=A0A6A5KBZ2_9PLEO|nr:hypothetical protein BDW02DRAFT_425051 [Decorospora gaudefroyi]
MSQKGLTQNAEVSRHFGSDEQLPVPHNNTPGFQQQLRDAMRKQQQLAILRRELLVKREELRSSSNKLKAKRNEASDVEATFMNAIRQVYYENTDVLERLFGAFEKVDVVHNDLGELQEDHERIERALVGSEWAFMDEEEDLYQFDLEDLLPNASLNDPSLSITHLHPHPPPPPPPPPPSNLAPSYAPARAAPTGSQLVPFPPPAPQLAQQPFTLVHAQRDHKMVVSQLDDLRATFRAQRQEQLHHLDLGDLMMDLEEEGGVVDLPSNFEREYSQTLDSIADYEVKAQQLREEAMQQSLRISAMQRRSSDSHYVVGKTPIEPCPMERTLSESAMPMLSNNPSLKQRICQWLLTNLKESLMHRALYLNILRQYGVRNVDGAALEKWVTQYWEMDDSGDEPRRDSEHALTEIRGTARRELIDNDGDASKTAHGSVLGPLQKLETGIEQEFSERTHLPHLEPPEAEFLDLPFSPANFKPRESAETSRDSDFIVSRTATDDAEATVESKNEPGYDAEPAIAPSLSSFSVSLLPVPASAMLSRTDSCQDMDETQRTRDRERNLESDPLVDIGTQQPEPIAPQSQEGKRTHMFDDGSTNLELAYFTNRESPSETYNTIHQPRTLSPNL